MKTFEEWCQDREIVLNELSPKLLAMAYKIWGKDCFVEGQRHEAENAALRERLEKALELPRIERLFNGKVGSYKVVYQDKNNRITSEYYSEEKREAAEARLVELKGEEK